MKLVRCLLAVSLIAGVPHARAADADEDWKVFGGMLSLVQSFVRIAASTDDPRAMQQGMDALLSGRNPEANRLGRHLMKDVLEDMPAQYHGTVSALAQDILAIARREQARAALRPAAEDTQGAIQARKELHAMGLRYWDTEQYRDAVRRRDAIAVELYERAGAVTAAPRGRAAPR